MGWSQLMCGMQTWADSVEDDRPPKVPPQQLLPTAFIRPQPTRYAAAEAREPLIAMKMPLRTVERRVILPAGEKVSCGGALKQR